MSSALLVIDVQNDYFAKGALPLWQVDETASRIVTAIHHADTHSWPVIAIRHVAATSDAFLFRPSSPGVPFHDSVAALLADRPVVTKRQADAFFQTDLRQRLDETAGPQGASSQTGITDLYLCGMMTQNCITHTALSPETAGYRIHVLGDACTAPSELVHRIALRALAARCDILDTSALATD